MMARIAMIAGASGLTGGLLVKQLLKSEEFHTIKVLSRKPLGFNSPKVKEFVLNSFEDLPLDDSKFKADVYFCCVGSTIKKAGSREAFRKVDHDAVLRFAKLARAQEARAFVLVSALGANADSLIFYNRVKGETEREVQALGIPRTVIFRPSLLLGHRQEKRTMEGIFIAVVNAISPLLPGKIQRSIGTRVDDLARAMIHESLLEKAEMKIIEAQDLPVF